MSSPSTPGKAADKVTGFTSLGVRVPSDFADEFTELAASNTGNISAEIRLAMRNHVRDLKQQAA